MAGATVLFAVIHHNVITDNNNATVPVNESTARAGLGAGVILPGDYADLVEQKTIANNENNGVFGIEYPTSSPHPRSSTRPLKGSIFFQLAGNRIGKNAFLKSGSHGGPFTGDVTLATGAGEIFLGVESQSKNNCVSDNEMTGATFPDEIEEKFELRTQHHAEPGRWHGGVRIHRALRGRSLGEEKTDPAAGSAAAADHSEPVQGGSDEPAVPVSW